jgi:hypothetical protein
MPLTTHYLNGTTLSNSTTVYDDAALTIVSADGFYADGSGISREQVSGILGPIQNCPTCLTDCGLGTITHSSGEGVFLLDIDLGDTVSDEGAVIVKFTPASIPDGIRATYNNVVYNKFSLDNATVGGYKGSTVANGYTYLGYDSATCLPIAGTTYSGLTEYRYNGTSFASTGNTQDITPQAGELQLNTVANPGTFYMVIPKVSQSIKELNIEISGVCPTTAFTVEVDCPVLLTGFSSSLVAGSSAAACALSLVGDYFNAPVSGTAGNPAINDWVFSDEYGSNVLAQGFYKINATEYIEVDANGVVIDRANC